MGFLQPTLVLLAIGAITILATPPSTSETCSQDWCLDQKDSNALITCWNDPTTVAFCDPKQCSGFPVCHGCKAMDEESFADQIECKREFHAAQGEASNTICVDVKEKRWNCVGDCTGSLSCSRCTRQGVKFTHQLQKRGNPFSSGMLPGSSRDGFEGELAL